MMETDSLFRDPLNAFKEIAQERLIPFYLSNPDCENSIISFLKSVPPLGKARIMTLFEPTGTGKTTLVSNIPKRYDDVYCIFVPSSYISILNVLPDKKMVWLTFFAAILQTINLLETSCKSVDIIELPDTSGTTTFGMVHNRFTSKLGKNSYLLIHVDEFQRIFDRNSLQTLFTLNPCTQNVKIIVTGTTALGDKDFHCFSDFETIPCEPLPSFDIVKVQTVLNKVLFWEELEFQKTEIENMLVGTPKNVLLFLKVMVGRNGKRSITHKELTSALEETYKTYKEIHMKRQNAVIGLGKKNGDIFTKLVFLFSFPNEFGFETCGNGMLKANEINPVIEALLTFNHSGLVRIFKSPKDKMIYLAIPDNFTIRYIRENTLYFPDDWLDIFDASCTVSPKMAEANKGYSFQILLSILLLNEHSKLSVTVHEMVKQKLGYELYKIEFNKKKTFNTFEGLPEETNIDGPAISKDGKTNSCVDLILPYSYAYENEQLKCNFIVQITCQKDVTMKAKDFFDRIARYSNSLKRKDVYTECIALFITVHPLEKYGNARKIVDDYLNQTSFILLDLSADVSIIPGLDLKRSSEGDVELLSRWIRNGSFLNIEERGNVSILRETIDLEEKRLSPYGSSKKMQRTDDLSYNEPLKKKKKESNIGSSQMHSQLVTIQEMSRKNTVLKIGQINLDTNDCSAWELEDIKTVMVTKLSEGGMGLHPKQCQNIEMYGYNLENVIDRLINSSGNELEIIENTCQELNDVTPLKSIQKSIVRWVYKNILERKLAYEEV